MYKYLISTVMFALASVASASGLLLPPFTYVGRIVDGTHAGAVGVTVRAWNARGELVARTTTYENGTTPCNYRLVVPVATTETRGYTTVGETLAFEIATGTSTFASLVPAEKRVVGDPGDIVTVDLMAAASTTVEGVSDAYLAGIRSTMRRAGHAAWESSADWDNDGMSNYAEYVAGTNPFDGRSKLAVTMSETTADESGATRLTLTFTPVAGRIYSVGGTSDLASGSWSRTLFATTPDGATTTTYVNAVDATPLTFYLPHDMDRSAAFYRLQVE